MLSRLYHFLDRRYTNKAYLYIYRLFKLMLNIIMPIIYCISSRNPLNTQSEVIISFTSFPARIKKVHLVVESLLRQTVMPREIVLYLSEKQFSSYDVLPFQLKKLEKQGFLRIRLVPEDFKPHKKYYYAVTEYSDSDIITVDDDLLYPEDFVEGLINAHAKYVEAICCNHASKIISNANTVLPYKQWQTEGVEMDIPRFDLLPIGCGGVYYPRHSFNNNILLRQELFMELCPLADDLWLKCNTLLCERKTVRSSQYNNFVFVDILIRHNMRLCDSNVSHNRNDAQMCNILKAFPQIIDILERPNE